MKLYGNNRYRKIAELSTLCLIIIISVGLFSGKKVCAATFFDNINQRLDDAGVDYHGFIDARGGRRIVNPVKEQGTSMLETRLQLEVDYDLDWAVGKFKGDLYADAVEHKLSGDLREVYLLGSPLEFADLKIGRQVLTWGTGDLLFINDLFPKDWQAFFIGRDDEYLKAPADAARLSLFFDWANFDLVYMPRFNPSNYINGERLSYWSPSAGKIVGRNRTLKDHDRASWFANDEIALRLYRRFGPVETALYFYDGYWKTPEGMKTDGKLFFPRLRAFGGSLRAPLAGGLAHFEAGYYDSLEDGSGKDPMIRNSEWRLLAGYEHELIPDLTGGFQYYLEAMDDYHNYEKGQPPGVPEKDEFRHLLTLRLTQLMLQQNLKLSLFVYYSPSDNDTHIRPQISYKITDNWLILGGANLFYGKDEHTFFGQFADNSNLYTGLRYSY